MIIMNEIWKPIVGYEGLYEVSNLGNVRSLNYNGTGKIKILSCIIHNDGYYIVNLHKDGKQKTYKIHRLVAQAFIPNPDNKPEVNHINEDKTDNRACNLNWMTSKENINWGTGIKRRCQEKEIPVKQMNLDGTLVTIWPSATEAGKNGYKKTSISACCRGEKYRKTYKGYKWAYE